MSFQSHFDEPDAEANWRASLNPLDVETMIQYLTAQGYVLSEEQRDCVRQRMLCKAVNLQDIVIELVLTKYTDDTDYQLGWRKFSLA